MKHLESTEDCDWDELSEISPGEEIFVGKKRDLNVTGRDCTRLWREASFFSSSRFDNVLKTKVSDFLNLFLATSSGVA